MKNINPKAIRWYQESDEQQKLPSVTSVLQLLPDDPYIQKWKESLTEEAYLAYMNKIFERGDIIHKLCENHFNGVYEPITLVPEYQPYITGFHRFLALHGANITPYHTEYALYSAELGIAGRLDFLCEWDTQFTLVDWKTSASARIPPSMVEKYRAQTAFYVKIWNVTHDRKITQAVIVPLTAANKKGLWVPEILDANMLEEYWEKYKGYILDMNLLYNEGYLPPYLLL